MRYQAALRPDQRDAEGFIRLNALRLKVLGAQPRLTAACARVAGELGLDPAAFGRALADPATERRPAAGTLLLGRRGTSTDP